MFIPYGTDRPQRRFPWANIALIAANVVVFALSSATLRGPGHDPQAAAVGLARDWWPYMLTPADPRLYQFITYQFLHAGLAHIGFNMLFLYVFGNNLNEKLGHIGYLLFYLAGGVLAGCGQVIVSHSPTLGASGAISAVTGLYLVLLPRTHIKMFVFLFIMDVWEIPSMYFILFKAGQDVFEQWSGGANVAYMAHLSGTVAGILIGLLLLATHLVQRDYYDVLAILNLYRRRQEYRAIVARGYDPFAPTAAQGAQGISERARGVKGTVNVISNADPRIDSLRAEIARLLRVHESAPAAQKYLELRAIDPTQVLPAQEQVDVASQLRADGNFAPAAAAFEDYLRVYPTGGAGQQTQIALLLGLMYARYLANPARGRQLLEQVLPGLHNPQEKELAEAELKGLGGGGGVGAA